MYCFECGTKLPPGAPTCAACGTPQALEAASPKPAWETCEIVLVQHAARSGLERDMYVFRASAVGPAGASSAGESAAFTLDPRSPSELVRRQVRPHLMSLVARLQADGWEPLPPDGDWFGFRFRRRAIPQAPAARPEQRATPVDARAPGGPSRE